ncbi:MAG: lysophospholipid acyltransferase family protein [Myxococcota bacterium]
MKPLLRPRSARERASGTVRGVLVTLFLALVLAFGNLLQLLTLPLLPLSRTLFLRANGAIVQGLMSKLGGLAERLHRLRVVLSGAQLPPSENALVLVNHQCAIDINCVFSFAYRHGRLGDLRWFAKAALRNMPGIGWGLRFLDTIFVTRRWETDARTIAEVFARMQGSRLPFWLLLFPEGARQTPARLAEAQARAIALGEPPLSHLLWPRTRGFIATLGALRARTDAIYDLTIGYPHGVPHLWDLLCGYVREVHLEVERIPIDAVPLDPAAEEAWLIARWRAKDARMEAFSRDGRFSPESP